VNDRRELGTYVGGYGLVMENGLPSETTLTIRRKSGKVYDLVRGREVEAHENGGQLEIPLKLGPCEGRVLMVTDRPIRKMEITMPESLELGREAKIELSVSDGKEPIDAVIPVNLRIIDPEGVEAERSGYYGAAGGKLTISLDIAPNDRPGLWEIRATELAGGIQETAYFRVMKLPVP
jgi:hypothetical protein